MRASPWIRKLTLALRSGDQLRVGAPAQVRSDYRKNVDCREQDAAHAARTQRFCAGVFGRRDRAKGCALGMPLLPMATTPLSAVMIGDHGQVVVAALAGDLVQPYAREALEASRASATTRRTIFSTAFRLQRNIVAIVVLSVR